MARSFEITDATYTNRGPGRDSQLKLPPLDYIFGSTPAMALMREQVAKLAAANLPVLLTGESGTGKGVMAAVIHGSSPAAKRPLIHVNCAALPATLVESELFGYEQGAYSGAS